MFDEVGRSATCECRRWHAVLVLLVRKTQLAAQAVVSSPHTARGCFARRPDFGFEASGCCRASFGMLSGLSPAVSDMLEDLLNGYDLLKGYSHCTGIISIRSMLTGRQCQGIFRGRLRCTRSPLYCSALLYRPQSSSTRLLEAETKLLRERPLPGERRHSLYPAERIPVLTIYPLKLGLNLMAFPFDGRQK